MPGPARQPVVVDDDRLLDLACELIAIPSENPPGDEQCVADVLLRDLLAHGWDARRTEAAADRPNIVARLEGRQPGPHLLFDGHLDVVPAGNGWSQDPYTPTIRHGRLIGRGAADMKGGVAAMVAAAEAVRRAGVPLRGTLTLAMVADEEEGGCGTRALLDAGLRATWAIVPEPTELRPVVAHKGSANLHIRLRGMPAHASTPELGVNAIEHAMRVLAGLDALRRRTILHHELLGPPTLTVCTIAGGFNDYTVPDQCQLTLNRRLVPPERADDVLADVQAVLAECRSRDATFDASVELRACTPPLETPVDAQVARALRSATEAVTGADPGVYGWSATCDASLLSQAGAETVVFGPGSIGHDAHRPDESVAVDQLQQCARIFALTIAQLLGGSA
jgi:acetylornithine deacetylase/succinyl-diaminopimelate desuccinylase family protein